MKRLMQALDAIGGRFAVTVLLAAGLSAGCSDATGYEVSVATYRSLVPTAEQLELDIDGDLPGGVVQLHNDGTDRIEATISDRDVTFRIDGFDILTRDIVERTLITDSEGSGPFRAKKEILVLGDDPLVLGSLVIDAPVIWPGSFELSPVITIKPRNREERGPTITCGGDEPCLLLSSGTEPVGSFADANNPELDENPIDSIEIDDQEIGLTLDTGDRITIPAVPTSFTRACALSENPVWALPPDLGLPVVDPVLVHTICPSTPGAAIQLIVMDRSALPRLAPLTEATEGNWCAVGPDCLLFNPT